jgi:hypothetical protein
MKGRSVCAPATLRRTTTWVGAASAAAVPASTAAATELPPLLPAVRQSASGVQVPDRVPPLLCMLCCRSGSWRGWGG